MLRASERPGDHQLGESAMVLVDQVLPESQQVKHAPAVGRNEPIIPGCVAAEFLGRKLVGCEDGAIPYNP